MKEEYYKVSAEDLNKINTLIDNVFISKGKVNALNWGHLVAAIDNLYNYRVEVDTEESGKDGEK